MVARRGTNGQVRGYTNCLTSTLACTNNAEVGGSIPPSPTVSCTAFLHVYQRVWPITCPPSLTVSARYDPVLAVAAHCIMHTSWASCVGGRRSPSSSAPIPSALRSRPGVMARDRYLTAFLGPDGHRSRPR
jgi:hypothetical protein